MDGFKISLFAAMFLCLLQAACAGSVTTKNGQLNATGNLFVGNNLLVVNTALGFVGIGISSPAYTLHVIGNATFKGNVAIGADNATDKFTVNGTTRLDGNTTITGPVNVTNNRITGLALPTDTTDAVNKAYVDALSGTAGSTQNCFVMSTPMNYIMTGDIDAASRSNCIIVTPPASGSTIDCNNRVIWSNPAGSGTGIRIVRGTHDVKISNCNFIDTAYAYYIEDAYNIEVNGGYLYASNAYGAAIVNSNNVTFKGTIMDTYYTAIVPTKSNMTLDGTVITTRYYYALNPTSNSNLTVKNSNITSFGGYYPLSSTTSNVLFENSNIVGGTNGGHTLLIYTNSNLSLKNTNITTVGAYSIYSSGYNTISLQGVNLRHTIDATYPIAFDNTGRLTMQDVNINAQAFSIGMYSAGATTVTGTNVAISAKTGSYMMHNGVAGSSWSFTNLRMNSDIAIQLIASGPIAINGITATSSAAAGQLCHPSYAQATLSGAVSLTGITRNCG